MILRVEEGLVTYPFGKNQCRHLEQKIKSLSLGRAPNIVGQEMHLLTVNHKYFIECGLNPSPAIPQSGLGGPRTVTNHQPYLGRVQPSPSSSGRHIRDSDWLSGPGRAAHDAGDLDTWPQLAGQRPPRPSPPPLGDAMPLWQVDAAATCLRLANRRPGRT